MKKLLALLLIIGSVYASKAQNVTVPMMYKVIDSMSNTLDSFVTKTVLAPNAAAYNIDTLSLPPNSSGVFYLYYVSYDTVKKFVGNLYQIVMLDRVGTTYLYPYTLYNSVLWSNGLSTHQTNAYMNLQGGVPVLQVTGFGNGSVLRWHVIEEKKVTPL